MQTKIQTLLFLSFFGIGVFLSSGIPSAEAAACTGVCQVSCGTGQTPISGTCSNATWVCCGTPTTPTASVVSCPGGTVQSGICIPNTGLSSSPIYDILQNLMLWLFGIFGLLAIIAFVFSGLQYLAAAGDPKQADTAKANAKYAAIGIVVALSGLIIITAISQALNINPEF